MSHLFDTTAKIASIGIPTKPDAMINQPMAFAQSG